MPWPVSQLLHLLLIFLFLIKYSQDCELFLFGLPASTFPGHPSCGGGLCCNLHCPIIASHDSECGYRWAIVSGTFVMTRLLLILANWPLVPLPFRTSTEVVVAMPELAGWNCCLALHTRLRVKCVMQLTPTLTWFSACSFLRMHLCARCSGQCRQNSNSWMCKPKLAGQLKQCLINLWLSCILAWYEGDSGGGGGGADRRRSSKVLLGSCA